MPKYFLFAIEPVEKCLKCLVTLSNKANDLCISTAENALYNYWSILLHYLTESIIQTFMLVA